MCVWVCAFVGGSFNMALKVFQVTVFQAGRAHEEEEEEEEAQNSGS